MSDLLARLIAAGTPADLVSEVARELARAEVAQEAIEARRANDRERSNRRHVKSRDNTGDSVTKRDDPALSRPPNENNSNPPTHTHPDVSFPHARKADPFPKPDWADPQHWHDFKQNRKTKRLPNTATAHVKFLRDMEALCDDEWPPGRMFEAIVARGWASAAHDPREDRNGRQPRNTDAFASLRGSRPNGALDMVIQSERELAAEAERENPGFDWPARAALPPH